MTAPVEDVMLFDVPVPWEQPTSKRWFSSRTWTEEPLTWWPVPDALAALIPDEEKVT